jgi:hypothetical protein
MTRIIALALTATLFFGTIARAATCLSSAAEVRREQPKAWPKWTYGPQGERCWYSGKKPVFAKRNKEIHHVKAQPHAAPDEPTSAAPSPPVPLQSEGRNNKDSQSWDLEYRWPK